MKVIKNNAIVMDLLGKSGLKSAGHNPEYIFGIEECEGLDGELDTCYARAIDLL